MELSMKGMSRMDKLMAREGGSQTCAFAGVWGYIMPQRNGAYGMYNTASEGETSTQQALLTLGWQFSISVLEHACVGQMLVFLGVRKFGPGSDNEQNGSQH